MTTQEKVQEIQENIEGMLAANKNGHDAVAAAFQRELIKQIQNLI